MNSRRSAMDRFKRWAPPAVFKRKLEPRAVRMAQSELAKVLEPISPQKPHLYDLDDLYHRVARLMRQKESILSLSLRELRRVPWVLFYSPQGERDSQWIGCSFSVLQDYETWILQKGRSGSPVHALVHEFIRVYPRDIETFDEWRDLIRRVLRYRELPSLERWKTACEKHSLLEPQAPERFVSGLISSDELLRSRLASANLDQEVLRACNFLRVGMHDILARSAAQVGQSKLSEIAERRLLEFLTVNDRLRFDDKETRVLIACTFLDQYRHRDPPKHHLDYLREWFVQQFGNPHLPPHRRRRWAGVPDTTRLVIGRWLVDRNIDKFIDLMKETAMERHWRFREAFWRSLSRRHVIKEIWFVLGRDANALLAARGMSDKSEGSSAKLFGAEPSQSVLLMRLAGLTIAEWSHNGSCRIWFNGHPNAPRLFQERYRAGPLRAVADFSQPHLGSERYLWQWRIAEWLRDNHGPDIQREDYRVGSSEQSWSSE